LVVWVLRGGRWEAPACDAVVGFREPVDECGPSVSFFVMVVWVLRGEVVGFGRREVGCAVVGFGQPVGIGEGFLT
jgi:hypothetical protein